MGSVNRAVLIGNLGADATGKTVGTGFVVNFRLATSETWTDKQDRKQSRVEWHGVNYWGKGAEAVLPYLLKGGQVYVEGKIETRMWADKTSGEERKAQEIRAERVVLLGGPRGAQGNDHGAGHAAGHGGGDGASWGDEDGQA